MARWIPAVLMVLVLSGAVSIPVDGEWDVVAGATCCAGEEGASELPSGERTWWDALKAGGIVGAIIILCSIAGLALSIQLSL
ncbi:MAG: hypothetical protein N3A38_16485, partial [Planctomycetota bacterium]|nr:hypothetical protein [Planctomycetota bacterium]